MSSFNFEEFTGRSSRSSSDAAVTLQRGGIFALNAAAHQLLERDGKTPEYVVLLFDRDARVVGIRAATQDVAHAYRLRPQTTGQSCLISARAFVQAYDIAVDQGRRYPASLVDGNILAIDLKKPGEVVSKPRPKREASTPRMPRSRITSLPMDMRESAQAES